MDAIGSAGVPPALAGMLAGGPRSQAIAEFSAALRITKPRWTHLIITCAMCAGVCVPSTRAAELTASGLSFPFFDSAGVLTHKVVAKHGSKAGTTQRLQEVEIEYYEAGDPRRVVQRLIATEATWEEKKEILSGGAAIVVETEENRLTGEGFHFALGTSRLNIHRNFTMTNPELVLTSDRAVVDLVIDRKDESVKLRDVHRCEAIGNLRVKILPTATKKYDYEEAHSQRAVYIGATHTIDMPEPTRLSKKNELPATVSHFTIKLDPKSKPSSKLK